ncbi:hypothetical protein L1281_001219 [Neisseria sp. HSC-16F19]|nr:BPSS1780 family membrane protein [Neisseria sp. HSC-16F19]MCP2040636.1 hypothetical protein [Neisseria sp. HSC-16F19]
MSEHDFNQQPYAAPQPLDSSNFHNDNVDDGYLGEAQAVPAGNATSWLGNAWAIFKQQPGLWIGAGLAYLVISFVLALIPVAGSFLQLIATMFLGAGFVYAAAQVERNGQFVFGDIFAGFQSHSRDLGFLVLFSILYMLVLMIVVFAFAFLGGSLGSGAGEAANAGMSMVLVLVIFLAFIPYVAAFYLAPALVILQNETPKRALTLSWQAFTRNIGGAVICALLMSVAGIVAMIPLGLGLLVAMPLFLVVPYVVYRDVFFN